MKSNKTTLIQIIGDLKMAIIQAQQDLIAMKQHKEELESELQGLRWTPPKDAIKNALKRLGMCPRLKQTTRREAHESKVSQGKRPSTTECTSGSTAKNIPQPT